MHALRAKEGVEVVFDNNDLPLEVITDQNRLAQVLTNLLNNATKFTDKGSIHFGYNIVGEMVEFYVQDTGRGIPASRINDIFDRSVTLNNHAPGTGLGLAISKLIVERVGGEIGVESEEGVGTRFQFSIPKVWVK